MKDTFQMSLNSRSLVNDIYKTILFPGCVDIYTPTEQDRNLDMYYGVDTIITTDIGLTFTIQEKVRTYKYFYEHRLIPQYPDICLRYKKLLENGNLINCDYFTSISHYLLYIWLDKKGTGIHKWVLLNYMKMKEKFMSIGGIDNLSRKKYLEKNEDPYESTSYAISLGDFIDCGISSSQSKLPAITRTIPAPITTCLPDDFEPYETVCNGPSINSQKTTTQNILELRF